MKIQSILCVQNGNDNTLKLKYNSSNLMSINNKTTSITKLPNYNQTVYFAGLYDPAIKLQRTICTGLNAWGERGQYFGPKYFASMSVVREILSHIRGENPVKPNTLKALMELKARTANFQKFLPDEAPNLPFEKLKTGEGIKGIDGYKASAENFLSELRTHIATLDRTFGLIKLPDQEKNLFYGFVAETAPTLYAMGFEDAIPHATQVARKCMITAYKRGGTSVEILQAGLVGWLHDPKFSGAYSWSMLATHPVIAGSLAKSILSKAEMFNKLKLIMSGDEIKANAFIDGVSEALFINNDSKFVMDNAILHRFKFVPHAETGVSDWVRISEATAHQRFFAPSKAEDVQLFPNEVRDEMHRVSLSTGIKGVSKEKLELVLREVCKSYPDELDGKSSADFINDVMLGKITNKALLVDVRRGLEAQDGIYSIRVPGDNLFSHDQEVVNARLAAKSLVLSDPMLLSPYKILLEGVQTTVLGRINSFLTSFNDNVKYVAKEFSEGAKKWQKELYSSMLKAADELNGTSNFQELEKTFEQLSLDAQISELSKKVSDENTWGKYANVVPKDPEQSEIFHRITTAVKKHYDEAAENCQEMFAI